MTVSMLARRCGLSRSTLLYYESKGLLRRPPRTPGNYRAYGDADVERLQQISMYRRVGLSLSAIRTVLERPGGHAAAVLERRLVEIDGDIATLRGHQRAILRLLKRSSTLRRGGRMTKRAWVMVMRGAGFTEADMSRWHAEFERSAPDAHQAFLEYLHIAPSEIRAIRDAAESGRDEAADRSQAHPLHGISTARRRAARESS